MADEYEMGGVDAAQLPGLFAAVADAFQEELHDDEVALWTRQVEPERVLAIRAGGAIVASSALLTMRLAVPGGVLPMAGLTGVGVDPVHRRRGLLDRMVRAQLTAIHDAGAEAISGLWASEAGIYGRWGYGQATRVADLVVRSQEAKLLGGPAPGRPQAGSPAALRPQMRRIYDAVQPGCPGMPGRDEVLWDDAMSDFEHRRDGFGRLRALVTDGGYALYSVREGEEDGRPDSLVAVRELIAATPEARAVLWEHLLGLALTRRLHWPQAPEDEPLSHMLADSRAASSRAGDGMYLRLVDLPRALAERAYGSPVDVVLDVADDVCPWNAGRWRLAADAGGATCEPTADAPDLALSVTELGAAYLGGTPLALLGAAGRVAERTPGALSAASRAFKGVREPWCPAGF